MAGLATAALTRDFNLFSIDVVDSKLDDEPDEDDEEDTAEMSGPGDEGVSD